MPGSARLPLIVAAALSVVAPALLSARQPLTVWSGVYTAAQAERGHKAYGQHCSYCHHDDLLGGEDLPVVPPPLVGAAFEERWDGKTVGAIFQTLSETMPWQRKSLTPAVYADVLSYLLKENGFPAGTQELPADQARLDLIAVTMKKP